MSQDRTYGGHGGGDSPEHLTEGPALIHIRKLHKKYVLAGQSVEVLRGLDLSVKAGEMVAVLGASGVGKSTLLHITGTLDRPSEGQVLVDGQDLFRLGEPALAAFRNEHIGFVFQFHHLLPEFTALENVMMPALIGRVAKARAQTLAGDLLAAVGMAHRREHRLSEMSGGEQQRVAIARALARQPKILLADEPTGNLDERTGQLVFELLHRLNADRGLTTLVATHNERLAAVMDRRVRLADGLAHPVD